MAADASETLEIAQPIAAPPAIVFACFTDPALLVRWMGLRADLAPRPGGIFRLDYGEGDVALGAYLEVLPFARAVFTWGWEGPGQATPPGSSTVEVVLAGDDGGTLPRLRHRGLSSAERVSHGEGWAHFLPRLVEAAASAPAAAPTAAGD